MKETLKMKNPENFADWYDCWSAACLKPYMGGGLFLAEISAVNNLKVKLSGLALTSKNSFYLVSFLLKLLYTST